MSTETGQILHQPGYDYLIYPLLVFFMTRLLLVVSGYLSLTLIPPPTDIAIWHGAPDIPIVDMWGRWDSAWYLDIAQNGYFFDPNRQSSVAFFPLYPLLMRAVGSLIGSNLLAGELISNLSFIGALILLYQLTELEFADYLTARRAVLYIALFPTSFFFSAVYSESLFLLLAIGTLYAARCQKWTQAMLAGILCSATRVTGVIVGLVVLLEWLRRHRLTLTALVHKSRWCALLCAVREDGKSLATISLIPLGLGTYMAYLAVRFGDAFAFVVAQRQWDSPVIGPHAVIWNTISDLLAGVHFWWCAPLDLAVFFMAFALCFAIWRRLGESYGIYSLLCILIPMFTSTRSMSRYVLVAFPLFMMLAWWGRSRRFHKILTTVFTLLLVIFMMIFVSWRFIA
jgi:hypothetical protein